MRLLELARIVGIVIFKSSFKLSDLSTTPTTLLLYPVSLSEGIVMQTAFSNSVSNYT